jgi:hypothetical protein
MDNNLPPEIIKKINEEQLNFLAETINKGITKGSPDERKHSMKLRLLKKMNEKEYLEKTKYKRKNSRFS